MESRFAWKKDQFAQKEDFFAGEEAFNTFLLLSLYCVYNYLLQAVLQKVKSTNDNIM